MTVRHAKHRIRNAISAARPVMILVTLPNGAGRMKNEAIRIFAAERREDASAAGRDAADDETIHMLDTLLITMHEDFGWGYDRLSRLAEKWGETYDVYFPAMQSTEESDVYQERLDRATRSYIGDNQLYPFAERYPEIRQLGYGPRRTK